jgi:hypothetical protein
MKWLAILLFTTVLFSGCSRCSGPEKEWLRLNPLPESEDSLKNAVLFKGDPEAYRLLSHAYLNYSVTQEFLLYAMIMANNYDHPQAYFDVFSALTGVFWADLTKMDERSAEMAIEYLIIASEKEHQQAKNMVEKYGINREDNSKEQIIKIYKSRLVSQGIIEE